MPTLILLLFLFRFCVPFNALISCGFCDADATGAQKVGGNYAKLGTLRDDLGREFTAMQHKATGGKLTFDTLVANLKRLT
jgi:hypothetical protein